VTLTSNWVRRIMAGSCLCRRNARAVDWRNSDVKSVRFSVEAHGKWWLEYDLTTVR
jgi:hypothetical protein